MQQSYSTATTQTVAPPKPTIETTPKKSNIEDKEEESLRKLRKSLYGGLTFCTLNLLYGYYLVASQLAADPRQNDWLLMQSPLPTYIASIMFVLGVTWIGPQLMKNREPFTGLRTVMVIYNALQVVYSAYLVWMLGYHGWFGSYSYTCQACDFSNSPQAIGMLQGSYWYYFSKFVDFLDTVFFVLHKKYDHISLLHVSHHALMPVSMWFGVRFQPGGHNTLMGFLNSIVHTVMYAYYCLAAMGPRVRPFLWWKKYLTSMQIIQFMTVIVHSLQLLVIDCPGVPPQLTQWVTTNSAFFLVLFADFYFKSYNKSLKKSKAKEESTKILSNGVSSGHANGHLSNGYVIDDITNGHVITNGINNKSIQKDIPVSVSRKRGLPNSIAETAHKTIELCENMAFRTQRTAAI